MMRLARRAQQADHASATDAGLHLETKRSQSLGHKRSRAMLLEGNLGMRMQIAQPAISLPLMCSVPGPEHGATHMASISP